MNTTHKKLDDRAHLIARPSMYIGAVDLTKSQEFILEDNKIVSKEVEFVPGLIKIINEIIDNSVDEAIKTNFAFSNEISVKINSDEVIISDNGRGIPVEKNADGHYIPELCWANARSGSNFDDDANRTQIGMNGIGSFATACFSKLFIGHTDDGKKSYTINIKNNAESFTEKLGETKKRGTEVHFTPDLARFGLTEINETHQNLIKQRLINLSLSFPQITFKFNGKKIGVNSFKKYVALFNENFEVYETEDYSFAILPNANDDFQQFSYVNGLKIPDGGTHIDVISGSIVNRIRDKLAKKYKTIKPGDVKNKLMVIAFLKNLKNPKFNSQTKEKITNSIKELNDYLGDVPYDNITYKVMKNAAILDPIVEIYKIKEELKRRQELKNLTKEVKKIKSDKYLPATNKKKYILLTEGQSAQGGLMPVLGRADCGYFVLRGVPLNAYSADTAKFTSNKELTELFKILQNEDYEQIVIASDQDIDGSHIRGLLLGFFHRYMPELKGKVGILQTPVIAMKKGDKLTNWFYNVSQATEPKHGETSTWKKGLGSWDIADLKEIVAKDGLENMISVMDFDSDEILDDWLSDAKSDKRKEYILENEFSIAKI